MLRPFYLPLYKNIDFGAYLAQYRLGFIVYRKCIIISEETQAELYEITGGEWMIIPHYYEGPAHAAWGTMPNRAYYIPSSGAAMPLVEHRETSDRFQLLNGAGNFGTTPVFMTLQDAFYEVGYDASAFDSIPVPSVWQNHGYDHHQYTNIRYPFPLIRRMFPKRTLRRLPLTTSPTKRCHRPARILNFEGCCLLLLCLAQRSVCRVQSGGPFHKRVRCNEVFAGRHQPSGGPRC